MKAITPILVALLLASSTWAGVVITCDASGNNVTIGYDRNDAPGRIRAFALDITVDNGATINAVGSLNPDYDIYPGSIVIDAQGNVTNVGTPVADQSDAPSDTLGGLATSGITIEMGSLYASGETPPANTGDLLTLTVSGECNVTITENVIRGGIVLEDPAQPANPSFTGCEVGGVQVCDCLGDLDGNNQINLNDLTAVVNLLVSAGSPFIVPVAAGHCGDFDQNGQVNLNDLTSLVNLLVNAGSPFIVPCP